MTYILKEKINIGVSACNFGAKVRYNRKGQDRVSLLEREKDAFIWTPVCPEVMSGLGVPRLAMKLVNGNGDDFWQKKADMKNRRGKVVSTQVREGAKTALENIKRAQVEAFVFMEGSPSCGVYRTTLKNQRLGKPPGVFGSLLLKEELFLIPAVDLESPLKWWDWRRRLHAFVWLKRVEINNKKDLYEIWHNFKFLAQEIDRQASDKIGQKLANIKGKPGKKEIAEIKKEMLFIIRKPSTLKRIKGAAQKQLGFLCKHFGICNDKAPGDMMNKQEFVDRLLTLEKKAIKEGIDYRFVPVIYREER